jgi:hypothetical protein
MPTPNEYATRLHAARIAAAKGPGWNRRFRQELSARGLELSPAPLNEPDYPDGMSQRAPEPASEDDAWPTPTYIVWEQPQDVEAADPASARYALFAGEDEYSPAGGWEDIVFVGTAEECKANFGEDFAWGHIVNLDTLALELVATGSASGKWGWASPDEQWWGDRKETPMSMLLRK